MSGIFLSQNDFERIFTNHLKIETYTKSIESLFSLRLLNRIDYKPYYQRNYVWDNDKASYFIESILLGTEIPPLIFFNNGDKIEVIDGRQRFETIKRFKDSEFALSNKGLSGLNQLAKHTYETIGRTSPHILDIFVDAKLRIIEFQIVNEPRLNSNLEDKVKKEIFSRYNSGITPLRRFEIDNAMYNEDRITKKFKAILKEDAELEEAIFQVFFKQRINTPGDTESIGHILPFLRRFLIYPKFPIRYYAGGGARRDISAKLYEFISQRIEDVDKYCRNFLGKVRFVCDIHDIFQEKNLHNNRIMFECLLWGLVILEAEEFEIDELRDTRNLSSLINKLSENIDRYSMEDYHYFEKTMERHSFTARILEEICGINLQIYVDGSSESREQIRKLRQANQTDTDTKLSELENLRITKPDPSRNSIDDIARVMDRHRFMVRPPYQRSEVINLSKASAIIESILLGIKLPPIFVYKREDGIQEVIDGQQRLLTILGFIGKEYVDEDQKRRKTRNSNFKLRNLRILKHLEGKQFVDLSVSEQEKILDFEIFVVEIEERLNPDFNPIDLFIRLNDKPYPIKEHSFEMWNSWVDRDAIQEIRRYVDKYKPWFYVESLKKSNDRDRMRNEELFTCLAYLNYHVMSDSTPTTYLDIYQKGGRIHSRIRAKKDISNLLMAVSEDAECKQKFAESIKQTERFIYKLQMILSEAEIESEVLTDHLEEQLDSIFRGGRESRQLKRRMQDFYLLWCVLYKLNTEHVKHHRREIRERIREIFMYIKNLPIEDVESDWEQNFQAMIANFHAQYSPTPRRLRLTQSEREALLEKQGNRCAITHASIFPGDEIEIDHIKPLALGGTDTIDNLQITHKDANRKKGTKY